MSFKFMHVLIKKNCIELYFINVSKVNPDEIILKYKLTFFSARLSFLFN
jgi:hypothetical protein